MLGSIFGRRESAVPICQSDGHTTYSDFPVPPIEKGLPKIVESLCPECATVINARLFEDDGKVWMEKSCPDHGYVKDLYWSDVKLYLWAEEWAFEGGRGLLNPLVKNGVRCPSACGLCNMHVSHTVCGNIDLTNRCNMSCPVCFANANEAGYVCEPSINEVRRMLENYRAERPVPASVVQFAGGEPTIARHFFEAVQMARELGFSHIQVASNGLKFCDLEFSRRAKEAGLHTIYLQFDGLTEDIHLYTRGRKLAVEKRRVFENVREAGLKIVLVPTVLKGVNDHQLGDILKLAIENVDIISGITYQPVTFTGRIDQETREKTRFTLPDLAHALEEQTGIVDAYSDWFPAGCLSPFSRLSAALRGKEMVTITCHPHCSLATYLFVDEKKRATPITRFVDIPNFLVDMDRLARVARPSFLGKSYTRFRAFKSFHRYFDESKAPEGLTFIKFLQTLDGLTNKEMGRGERDGIYTFKTLMVGGMHFMDSYNYQVERVRRCIVHYSAPNGLIYPFCTYNSGPTYRDKVECRYSVSLDDWRKGKRHREKGGCCGQSRQSDN